ncbi:hypothetical protein [Priestia endophytica]|uniref:hypothetical protein n=1 Tax=Priestia endophytica TaxID=135735 RepID=UPI002E1ECA5F|nr:hypothetical protein [Priestia endophytica]
MSDNIVYINSQKEGLGMFFDNDITFIYFQQYSHGLISLDHHLRTSNIRSYLEDRGISTVQYIDNDPGSLNDVVDDVSFSLGNYIAFYIDSTVTFNLSYNFAAKLKVQDSSSKIIFILDDSFILNNQEINNSIDFILTYAEYPLLKDICQNVSLKDIDNFSIRTENIYSNKLIPVNKIQDTGLEIHSNEDLSTLDHELEFIKSNIDRPLENNITIVVRGTDVIPLFNLLNKYDLQFKVVFDKYNEFKEFDIYVPNNVREIQLHIREKEEINKLQGLKCPISVVLDVSEKNIKVVMEEVLNNVYNNRLSLKKISFLQSDAYYEISNEISDTLIGINKHSVVKNSRAKEPLKNGLYASQTGVYPFQNVGAHVKHFFQVDSLNKTELSEIDNLIGINSAAISENTGENNKYYIYNGTVVWIDDREINSLVAHNHTIYNNNVILDNEILSKEMSFKRKTYKEIYNSEEIDNKEVDNFPFLNLEKQEDLDLFLQDISKFKEEGMLRGYQVKSHLINSCRWMGPTACTVKNLPRLYYKGGELNPCGDCHDTVGSLGDNFYELKSNAQQISEEEQVNRGCINCEVRDTCSKCTFLPSYMNSNQYCFIRKSQPQIEHYMLTTSVLKMLIAGTSYFRKQNIQDIRISNKYTSHYLHLDKVQTGDSYINRNVFLFSVNQEYILFDLNKNSLKRIGKMLAVITEALYKGFNNDQIKQEIVMQFSVNNQEASNLYNEAIKLFLEENIVSEKGVKV